MTLNENLITKIQEEIDTFTALRSGELEVISSDLIPLAQFSADLLSSGKRFRALGCFLGWLAVQSETGGNTTAEYWFSSDLIAPIAAASSLEFFHAAALVHDDLIDNSDTRRGRPAIHKQFQLLHEQNNWQGSAEEFGKSAALLLGDQLLAWADELFDNSLAELSNSTEREAVRKEFAKMRREVIAGQYLDILEEQLWHNYSLADQLDRAMTVIIYKSARYSVVSPLLIGASLAGANQDQLQLLESYGEKVGVAFQLRDDLLGIYGDSKMTGKPSGDDIRQGKRTVLIALARTQLSVEDRTRLDQALGDQTLADSEISAIQELIKSTDALEILEQKISELQLEAKQLITESQLHALAKSELLELAERATKRNF